MGGHNRNKIGNTFHVMVVTDLEVDVIVVSDLEVDVMVASDLEVDVMATG